MGVTSDADGFPADGRFELRNRLGSGGMGTVWVAWDRERALEVALKTLRTPEPGAIYRFKREFRALADVTHPNLVTLHELFNTDGRWFFTMELLDGDNVLRYLRGDLVAATHSEAETLAARPAPDAMRTVSTSDGSSEGAHNGPEGRAPAALPDLERLRSAMEQLTEGVMALHARGWLHRDIKPSNVLVTREGRVVLLDFGIVAEMGKWCASKGETEFVGTPSFMSPEQARGEPAGPASDWYSVGLLLYQGLTGRRAFSGSTAKVLEDKQVVAPLPPRTLCPDAPPELDELCVALTQREPEDRPDGRDILTVLRRGRRSSRPHGVRPSAPAEEVDLVGRATQLGVLRDAFDRTSRGRCEVVMVHGTSGTGKTALVSRFLRELGEIESTVVLSGRCYERESVPYKAVDSIVDELCSLLMELPAEEVERYVPRDANVLAQVFPVLRRLDAVSERPSRETGSEGLPEVRRRAFGALREMLRRLARDRRLVVFIDDMQWGDADSSPLLETLVRPPDPPALLLVGSYRTDERDRSPLLNAMLGGHGGIARSHRDLALQPLPREQSETLAATLLERAGADPSSASTIARESAGNPYFIHELVRFAQVSGDDRDEAFGLDEVIRARVKRLKDAERQLLEAVAVASKPLPQGVAHEAAAIDPVDRPAAIQQLASSQLLRTSGARERDAIECYHDRIREAVVSGLSPGELQRWHVRLADALEADGSADAETLAEHLQGAEQHERAASYAVEAAEHAIGSLSFEHAANLYRLALSLRPQAPAEHRSSLHERLGEALANAGRGAQSARAFLDAAAATSDPSAARDLRRRAGEQYLRAGYVDDGLELVREVLGDLDLRLPATARGTIASLLYHRTAMRLRGLRFTERPAGEVSEHQRMLADACSTTATGLAQVDPLRGSLFASRAVREALRTGDRHRAARAIYLEALMLSSGGARARRITERYIAAAERIARPLDDPSLRGMTLVARGVSAFELGDFAESCDACERALEEFRGWATGNFWELGTTELFSALAQLWTGRFDMAARLTPSRLSAAEERGDLYTATCLRTAITPILYLLVDEPEAARREGQEALALWRIEEFQNQHYMAFAAQVVVDLYTGDLDAAVRRCETTTEHMSKSLLKHVQVIRASWRLNEGLCLLAAAARESRGAGPLLRRVRGNARRLSREGAAWCDGASALLRAGLALRESDRDRALELLEVARERFARCGMGLFGEPCDWRIGILQGGEEGEARARAVEERWRAQGVVRPRRLLEAFAVPV